jgi:hypothetical protein
MDVLEASVTELSPSEVSRAVADGGHPLAVEIVEDRLLEDLVDDIRSAARTRTFVGDKQGRAAADPAG